MIKVIRVTGFNKRHICRFLDLDVALMESRLDEYGAILRRRLQIDAE